MRRFAWFAFLVACGGNDSPAVQDAPPVTPDTPEGQCQALGATGQFYRRDPNPKLVAGGHTFSDGKIDTHLENPDLVWDASANLWHLYYESPHGTFASAPTTVIRHATSPDLATWTFTDTPVLTPVQGQWDTSGVHEPSVTINPDAPASQRFTLVYDSAGALGVATSADGATFTRINTNGRVLQLGDVYPGATAGGLFDPEIVAVAGTYHLWFASSASTGVTPTRGIAYATSTDGATFGVQQAPVPSLLRTAADLTSGFDAPSVIYDDLHCRWEMWFADSTNSSSQPVQMDNQNGVFHASSTNGTSWTKDLQNLDVSWDSTKDGEAQGLMAGADVGIKATGRYMIYPAFDDANVPSGSTLPASAGTVSSVMTLDLATRDAPL